MFKQKIIFIDRDGTLIDEPEDKQIDSLEKLALEPHVIPVLLKLQKAGYQLVMVSNQDGLGTPRYPQACFDQVQNKLLQILTSQGIYFSDIHICPHVQVDNCDCHKPKLGLVRSYLMQEKIDLNNSYVIGDRQTDLELADNMEIQGLLYQRNTNNWLTILSQLTRRALIQRQTTETNITASVSLDIPDQSNIKTTIGFFDHMLEQFAKHAGISLCIVVAGDLHVDEHHTVEDTAMVIGQLIRQALGDKIGIQRYGFLLPMDDALTQVAIDLSGRAFFEFDGKFTREKIGDFATEMIPHFFRSLANSLNANIHIKVTGENNHHMVESIFKAVGRALRQAMVVQDDSLPSTKGIL